jgi:predicted acylesterase/phospholipase RssA
MLRILGICSVLILLALVMPAQADGDKCYVLALEGGGDKGAYQAGALAQIIESSDPSEVQYDVVSGVSIGSINGAFLAGFAKGEEKAATENMLSHWRTLTQDKIYKDWPWGGPVRGLLQKTALYDSSPFREYIRTQLTPPLRSLIITATDARTGAAKFWDETTDWQTLLRAIDASSSYPGFFEPITDLDDTVYYDGGTSFSVNIFSPIAKCVDMGYDYSQIVVDVILCSGATFNDEDVSKYTSIPMLLRYLEIERYYDTMELLERATFDFKGVTWRHVVVPTEKLEPGLIPMVFNHKQILNMIEKGRSDAKKIMKMEPGKSTEFILEYTKKKMHEDYAENYSDFLKTKSD